MSPYLAADADAAQLGPSACIGDVKLVPARVILLVAERAWWWQGHQLMGQTGESKMFAKDQKAKDTKDRNARYRLVTRSNLET